MNEITITSMELPMYDVPNQARWTERQTDTQALAYGGSRLITYT